MNSSNDRFLWERELITVWLSKGLDETSLEIFANLLRVGQDVLTQLIIRVALKLLKAYLAETLDETEQRLQVMLMQEASQSVESGNSSNVNLVCFVVDRRLKVGRQDRVAPDPAAARTAVFLAVAVAAGATIVAHLTIFEELGHREARLLVELTLRAMRRVLVEGVFVSVTAGHEVS